jgi:NAD(P)-dependent dehydrogenase (short-subunit alcohol dehydrogenase family)
VRPRRRPGERFLGRRSRRAGRLRRHAATKWGIDGWSEALRVELQPDIRVTVIEPGAIATELAAHITHADTASSARLRGSFHSIDRVLGTLGACERHEGPAWRLVVVRPQCVASWRCRGLVEPGLADLAAKSLTTVVRGWSRR